MTGTASSFPNREAVAEKLQVFADTDKSFIQLIMENAVQDQSLIEGLHRHLDSASNASFLNTLKLEKLGEWIGKVAPARLQIRLMEAAKSSQNPAYAAFRTGLTRSGGLEKAYPTAKI